MRKQAERFGAELVADDVTEVNLAATPKLVKTDSETYQARSVIVATGSRYRELVVAGEKRLSGHGVSWCATCDGFFFRDLDIAVIGGGDSAMEEATFLTRFAKSVTVVHRRDQLRASKIMQDRAFANPKISFRWNSEVAEVLGEARSPGCGCGTPRPARRDTLKVNGLFVAIGHDPRSELFTGQLPMDSEGYLDGRAAVHPHRRGWRLRLRRRGGPHLPPGGHRGRHRMCRRDRRRAVAGGPSGRFVTLLKPLSLKPQPPSPSASTNPTERKEHPPWAQPRS